MKRNRPEQACCRLEEGGETGRHGVRKLGEDLGRDLRHAHTLSGAPAKRHHMMIQRTIIVGIKPPARVKLHRFRKHFLVAMHEPRRHADDGASRDRVAVESRARVRRHTWYSTWNPKGKTQGFFDDSGLLRGVLRLGHGETTEREKGGKDGYQIW